MINLTNNSIWTVEESDVGSELRRSIAETLRICRVFVPMGTSIRNSNLVSILKVFESIDLRVIDSWSIDTSNKFMAQAVRDGEEPVLPSAIAPFLSKITGPQLPPFRNFVRMVLICLWSQEVLIAPHDYIAPTNVDDILDELIVVGGNKTLAHIRSMNKLSKINYVGSDKLEDRNRRANHWLRLLLNTSFYNSGEVSVADVNIILAAGAGKMSELGRYYPADFLLTISFDDMDLKGTVSSCIRESREAVMANIPKREHWNQGTEPRPKSNVACNTQKCLDYANAESQEISLDYLISDVVGTARIHKIFGGLNADMGLPIYKGLPSKVSGFCELINRTFSAFVNSQGVQVGKNHAFSLNLTIFYISIYLPRFYLDRDGSLDKYPVNLNDFNCAYYVTRDSILDDIAKFEKVAPLTLVAFIKKYAETFMWANDTHYNRILYVEKYFEYLVNNNSILPDADNLVDTFTKANYPKTSRRFGTNKKPIPRKYFATFVNLLYTLEYLVDHVNAMADGIVPGSLDDKLHYLTRAELEEHHIWGNLWGKVGNRNKLMDLSLLNYTPIYLHDGKYRSLKKCHKFYTITTYEQKDGSAKTIATPHQARATLLMCETGIRQKHLLWLDVERYDCFVDRSFEHILAPLLINTDKAHGEWTAIVSSRVIKLCDRQREFYLSCGDPSFDEKIWYGETEGAKFGRFKPLFRQPKAETGWSNRDEFPKLLWTLQHIIREDLRDHDLPDLVTLLSSDKSGKRKELTEFTEEYLFGYNLVSVHTPHALRAGFVSNAIRFLPPSLIGEFMTGQTEALVWYYAVNDPEDFTSHQQLLANYISNNVDAISRGEAPELAATMAKVNRKLMAEIEVNPAAAVEKYKLMSLTGITEDKSGLKLILAKKYTKLAYNPTHICPFDNKCPKEVVEQYGLNRPHALCPYAVRGVVHLPAVSADKDKHFELMLEYQKKIKEYNKRPKSAQNLSELEGLNYNHDNAFREATALEGIEQQLYVLSSSEDSNSYVVHERDALVTHFKKVNLTEAEHLIKRLIDVSSFPDLESTSVNRKFAYCRKKMLLSNNDLVGLIAEDDGQSEAKLLTSQIKSMMDVKQLDIKDIFKIASSKYKVEQKILSPPLMSSLLAPAKDREHDGKKE